MDLLESIALELTERLDSGTSNNLIEINYEEYNKILESTLFTGEGFPIYTYPHIRLFGVKCKIRESIQSFKIT